MNHELCRLSWAHFICNRRIKIGDRKNCEKNMQIVDSHVTCIITRSWFETALDYKLWILRLKSFLQYKPLCSINHSLDFPIFSHLSNKNCDLQLFFLFRNIWCRENCDRNYFLFRNILCRSNGSRLFHKVPAVQLPWAYKAFCEATIPCGDFYKNCYDKI